MTASVAVPGLEGQTLNSWKREANDWHAGLPGAKQAHLVLLRCHVVPARKCRAACTLLNGMRFGESEESWRKPLNAILDVRVK